MRNAVKERMKQPGLRTGVGRDDLTIVLFSCLPFAGFTYVNRTQVYGIGKIASYAIFVALVALLSHRLIMRLAGVSSPRSAVATSVFIFVFFHYGDVVVDRPSGTLPMVLSGLWVVLSVFLGIVVSQFASRKTFQLAFPIVGLAMFAQPMFGYVLFRSTEVADPTTVRNDYEIYPPASRILSGPNVYWFILDGYARADSLQAISNFDNSDAVNTLSSNGFEVSTESRASYPRTHLSLASTLEMGYPYLPKSDISGEFENVGPVVRGANATVERFRSLGYRFIYAPEGNLEWTRCDPALADLCIPAANDGPISGELEQSLLDLTPLRSLLNVQLPHSNPAGVVESLDALVGDSEQPFFLMAHILPPHWPYRHDEECELRDRPLNHHDLYQQAKISAYTNEIRCVNQSLVTAVERILTADPAAYVLLQSDHGSDILTNWLLPSDEWSPAQVEERLSAFSAMRLPGCASDPGRQDLVNTFRLVFACLEDRTPALLEYRGFLSRPSEPLSETVEVDPVRWVPLDD